MSTGAKVALWAVAAVLLAPVVVVAATVGAVRVMARAFRDQGQEIPLPGPVFPSLELKLPGASRDVEFATREQSDAAARLGLEARTVGSTRAALERLEVDPTALALWLARMPGRRSIGRLPAWSDAQRSARADDIQAWRSALVLWDAAGRPALPRQGAK